MACDLRVSSGVLQTSQMVHQPINDKHLWSTAYLTSVKTRDNFCLFESSNLSSEVVE